MKPSFLYSWISISLHNFELVLHSLFILNLVIIVYYVPRQSSRRLYDDAEFNVRVKQFDCLGTYDCVMPDCQGVGESRLYSKRVKKSPSAGFVPQSGITTYDTLSEIGKRKREFICRGEEVKLSLIVLRTCTCEVISHFYRDKLDVAERGEGGPGGEGPGGRSGVLQ